MRIKKVGSDKFRQNLHFMFAVCREQPAALIVYRHKVPSVIVLPYTAPTIRMLAREASKKKIETLAEEMAEGLNSVLGEKTNG